MRTVQLPYTVSAGLSPVLLDLRRRQSRVVRTAYNRLCKGLPEKELYQTLRQHPVGQDLHTWITLSGIKKARALHQRFPEGKIVFGGRKKASLRTQNKITKEEWKASRLLPLCIEGHAKSWGSQGGNHLFTLDIANNQIIFHPSRGFDFPLSLKLSHKSRTLRRRLEELQFRCDTARDTPFSVSYRDTHLHYLGYPACTHPPLYPQQSPCPRSQPFPHRLGSRRRQARRLLQGSSLGHLRVPRTQQETRRCQRPPQETCPDQ